VALSNHYVDGCFSGDQSSQVLELLKRKLSPLPLRELLHMHQQIPLLELLEGEFRVDLVGFVEAF
jgi:hypothetical protein